MWMKGIAATLLIVFLSITSCKKTEQAACTLLSPLHEAATFPVGVAVNMDKLPFEENYRNLVISQFNSITPENVLKFNTIHPQQDYYEWQLMDSLVDFAKKHGKRIHGHTLIWHRSVPYWVQHYEGNWDEIIPAHTRQVISRYKNDIHSWDVVNEALNEDGTLRNSIWFEKISASYIEQAFKAAHETDKDALLFYNDYNLELNPRKLEAAINLCLQLKMKGIRVDGIGMQMHIADNYPSLQDIEQAARKITDAGFMVHFSEMDISMNPANDKTSFTSRDLQKQAERYCDIFGMYSKLNPEYRFGITLWGVSDADSWISSEYNRADIPLLFDYRYQPKPAYCEIKELFQ